MMHPLKSFRLETTVTVEYLSRGKRVSKTFDDQYAAKAFYIAKAKAGAEPKIVKAKDKNS